MICWRAIKYFLVLCAFVATPAVAVDTDFDAGVVESTQFQTTDQILTRTPDDTQCATAVFADALRASATDVSETDSEEDIQAWIHQTFSSPDVLRRVLTCPEIAGVADDQTITFMPVEYVFPGGRQVIVNYETQPKILRQRLMLGDKRQLPPGDASPRIDPTDGNVWTNTEPAWYAIMVVQHGALDDFVGRGRNNTISMEYIAENIDALFPQNAQCTGKSALTSDNTMINRAAHNMVDVDGDTNDYYVAGDVNLQWISYLEIGLDVAITAATMGGGTVIMGLSKSARVSRAMKNLSSSIRALSRTDDVRDYVRTGQQYARATAELQAIDRATDAARYAAQSDEVQRLSQSMREMERASDNVRQYRRATDSFTELAKYRHALRGVRMAKRGNIVARAYRALRATNTGTKALNRGARVARSSMQSGRVRDWLFHSTLSNAAALGRLERTGGMIYGALKFVGGMYDWTETSTGEFTNDIDFAPLLLLSADDLRGQENVVNHGMWLMWMGDSINPADDDAAYLQAMDAAAKFHQDLDEIQDESNSHPCAVDIYVVRPVIRNPGGDAGALYYLIMNDVPWTTAQE